MRVLLVNPPLTDPAGPYPSICYLAGFLETIGVRADLADASLALTLRLFTREGLGAVHQEVCDHVASGASPRNPRVQTFLERFAWYARTVETAVACLQGADRGAVARATRSGYFPPAIDARMAWARATLFNRQSHEALVGELTPAQRARLATSPNPLRFAFGTLGQTDEARFRASTVVCDLADVITCALDPDFQLDAYRERLAKDAATYEPIRARLEQPPGLMDRLIDETADELWHAYCPDVVGLTVPFPGSLYGALRLARQFKAIDPRLRTVMGGGYASARLRQLSDPGLFDYVDFVTLDRGERPLQCVLELLQGRRTEDKLMRTFVRRNGRVLQINGAPEGDVPVAKTGVPTYGNLPLRRYLALQSSLQPGGSLWRQRWNKITLAHGCYWKKCAFCDTRLDSIGHYEAAPVDVTIERIKRVKAETGESGFNFVDEAMPPALLRRLAERLIEENLAITWWGNVRFDQALVPLAPLLAESGCVAVTGGLEVASDRLLALMQKGVSLDQVARVTHALSRAGMTVHAYLIFGFPTETVQETIDALEFVRQLFDAGCLHSATWHRFMLTEFSPVAAEPGRFGIRLKPWSPNQFSNYVREYDEPGGVDHSQFGRGLKRATSLFMAGVGCEKPVHTWFADGTPATGLAPDLVRRFIACDCS